MLYLKMFWLEAARHLYKSFMPITDNKYTYNWIRIGDKDILPRKITRYRIVNPRQSKYYLKHNTIHCRSKCNMAIIYQQDWHEFMPKSYLYSVGELVLSSALCITAAQSQ